MAYNFNSFKQKTKDIEEWLKKEFAQVRTGRAAPALLDGVLVESYGARVPINQVGSVSAEDARTLRISLWDASHAKEVEKSIIAANLGVSVSVDDKGVRVFFPELTSERRAILTKLAKEKLEAGRVNIRQERDRTSKEIEAAEKKEGMGEDEKFRLKAELQKIVDETNKRLDELYAKKEKEISS